MKLRYIIAHRLEAWGYTNKAHEGGVIGVSSIDVEEGELIMNLSQAYLEWEQQTELRGKELERRELVENLLLARFGEVDSELTAITEFI